MVPKDWILRGLGSVLEKVSDPVLVDPAGRYQEIGIRSHGKGIFYKEPVLGSTIGDKRIFWVKPDVFIVNIVFAWEQAVARTTNQDVGLVASHRFPMFRPKKGLCDIDFLVHFFRTKKGKALLEIASPGGAGRNKTLGQKGFFDISFQMPPYQEQVKIAAIISTWDKAIETTENLYQICKMQKKALLQQLLVAKRKFPGFNDKWITVRLADVAEIIVSNVDKNTADDEKPIKMCNYTDVYHNQYITQTMNFKQATASEAEIKKFSLKKSDVLITKDSESADDIAVAACVRGNLKDVVCGYHLAIIRPKKNMIDGVFLNSLFSLDSIRYYFASRANGVTRFGLSVDAIREAAFLIPPFEEQCKISQLILAADDEIAAQQKRLDALKLEKQALMQQLLTGKRRVKVGETVTESSVA